jgi:3alpha(or 20beta)-hydroxysteroid dehydrogenase
MTNPEGRLAGKVAIISGGAGGIGAAVARTFVAEGAQVVIGDLLAAEGKALAAELGAGAVFQELDVRREESWKRTVDVAQERFGAPTILVQAAGIILVKTIEDTTADDMRRQFEVNVIGPFLGVQAVLPAMKQAGQGSIVIFSSGAGTEGTPMMSAYAASKAANANFAQSAAMAFGKYGIRVNAITPGGIDTPMSNQPQFDGHLDKDRLYSKLPIPRIGQPEDIAPLVLLLASDESGYITGDVINVDGGLMAGHSIF